MKKLLVCAAFATAATTLHASIIYNAFISCTSCVTVSLSWANEPVPISYAEVDDSLGGFLFQLNVGSPSTTGAILPDPQTVSFLSPQSIDVISNGQAGFSVGSIRPALNTFAKLDLLNVDHVVIDSTVFVASVEPASVPEPAGWSLTCAGLALLLLRMKRHRRNSQT